MITDVLKYFASKRALAEEEINKDSPMIAMAYRTKIAGRVAVGTYIATKIKSASDKIQPVGKVPIPDMPGYFTTTFIMAGVGNEAEFDELLMKSKHFTADVLASPGGAEVINPRMLLRELSEAMKDQFDNGNKSYGVELLVLSQVAGDNEIYRVKYDGTAKRCERYAVIGGYQTRPKGRASIRKAALDKMANLYEGKKLPKLKEVKQLAEKILGPVKGREKFLTTEFVMA